MVSIVMNKIIYDFDIEVNQRLTRTAYVNYVSMADFRKFNFLISFNEETKKNKFADIAHCLLVHMCFAFLVYHFVVPRVSSDTCSTFSPSLL